MLILAAIVVRLEQRAQSEKAVLGDGLESFVVLFAGLVAMARGKNSNVFMRWRVALQGIAILLFVLFMMLYHQS